MIEAKFELSDARASTPVADIRLDSERNRFFELQSDPTGPVYEPALRELTVPDAEHLTRSSRDLTLVQTAGLSLKEALWAAQRAVPAGFVYSAIPTIRDTRAGYGVYVYGPDGAVHYFFIS
jgi:hypothetical protein